MKKQKNTHKRKAYDLNLVTKNEYDFRNIPESEIVPAKYYEYARSVPWLLDVIDQWQKSIGLRWEVVQEDFLYNPKITKSLNLLGSESPMLSWVLKISQNPELLADAQLRALIYDSMPVYIPESIRSFVAFFPQFPEPWLSIDPNLRSLYVRQKMVCSGKSDEDQCGQTALPILYFCPEIGRHALHNEIRHNLQQQKIFLDLSATTSSLQLEFVKQVDSLKLKYGLPKAHAEHAAHLRALSVWRLRKYASYQQIIDFLPTEDRSFRGQVQLGYPDLPSFHRAGKYVDRLLDKHYPEPENKGSKIVSKIVKGLLLNHGVRMRQTRSHAKNVHR